MMLYRFEVDYTVPGKMGNKNYVTAVAATDAAHIVESAHLADKAGWLEGTVSCRIAYVDGGWCCPGEVFLHDTVEWDEVDQSNYVSTDSYGYYVGLCREVLGINGKYQKSCRLP